MGDIGDIGDIGLKKLYATIKSLCWRSSAIQSLGYETATGFDEITDQNCCLI